MFTRVGGLLTAPPTLTHIYGVEWDGTSTTKWTRTNDAATFSDPEPYVSGASTYGSPFDDLYPWSGMQISERAGGTMVAIPKFWYKLTQNSSGGMDIQIADKAVEGFSISPAHMERGDGVGGRDVVYIGRYHCGADDYKSVTGVLPEVSATRSAFRTAIHNLGDTIWQNDFATRFTIWLLYLVEFADWNSQNVIGYGCSANNAKANNGQTDAMPYHTGTTAESRTTYGWTQYRNIEGLWDNVYDWMDGGYNDANGMNVILNPADFSDTTGGISIGTPRNGYPSAFAVSSTGGFQTFIPSANSGSSSTYSCDSWYFGSNYPCWCAGGDYGQYQARGLFFMNCYYASNANGSIGSRLLELPQ